MTYTVPGARIGRVLRPLAIGMVTSREPEKGLPHTKSGSAERRRPVRAGAASPARAANLHALLAQRDVRDLEA